MKKNFVHDIRFKYNCYTWDLSWIHIFINFLQFTTKTYYYLFFDTNTPDLPVATVCDQFVTQFISLKACHLDSGNWFTTASWHWTPCHKPVMNQSRMLIHWWSQSRSTSSQLMWLRDGSHENQTSLIFRDSHHKGVSVAKPSRSCLESWSTRNLLNCLRNCGWPVQLRSSCEEVARANLHCLIRGMKHLYQMSRLVFRIGRVRGVQGVQIALDLRSRAIWTPWTPWLVQYETTVVPFGIIIALSSSMR